MEGKKVVYISGPITGVENYRAIFKQAEDNGFVHQITNIDGENKIFVFIKIPSIVYSTHHLI